MSYGKLTVDALEDKVLKYTGAKRAEVLVGAQFGEDSAALRLGDEIMVVSSDPITGAEKNAGGLAIVVSTNDVIANGAEPVAVLLTLLMPTDANGDDVEKIMLDAHRAAKEIDVEIIGGHTEFTDAVLRPVVSATTIGKAKRLIKSSNVANGNDIVLTKTAGLEGTAILFSDYAEKLRGWFENEEILEAQQMTRLLSIAKEGMIALRHQVTAMHDVTEGGVLGALYELSAAGGRGVKVFAEKIPVHPVTKRLCQLLEVNPLMLISSGALLIAVENGDALVDELQENGVQAAVIGRITDDERRVVITDGLCADIQKPCSDELWTAIKRLKVLGANG